MSKYMIKYKRMKSIHVGKHKIRPSTEKTYMVFLDLKEFAMLHKNSKFELSEFQSVLQLGNQLLWDEAVKWTGSGGNSTLLCATLGIQLTGILTLTRGSHIVGSSRLPVPRISDFFKSSLSSSSPISNTVFNLRRPLRDAKPAMWSSILYTNYLILLK